MELLKSLNEKVQERKKGGIIQWEIRMEIFEVVRWLAGVVGKRDIKGVNGNVEYLVNVCVERSLLFQHGLIHR